MIISLSSQANLFLVTILIGFIIGLVYDFFRITRKLFHHSNLLVYIEDLLFWIISTFICFYILLHKNNLELRFYIVIGIIIGLCLYFSIFSQFVLNFFIKIIFMILTPMSFILKLFSPYMSKFYKLKHKAIYREKIVLQKVYRYGKIKKNKFKSTIKIIKNKI